MRQKQILFFVIFIEILKNILLFKKVMPFSKRFRNYYFVELQACVRPKTRRVSRFRLCDLWKHRRRYLREEGRHRNGNERPWVSFIITDLVLNSFFRLRIDYSITKRAHSPTPGCYLGSKGDRRGDRRGSRRSRSRERYSRHGKRSRSRSRENRRRSPSPYRRRSPSPYRSRRSRSR